MLANLIRVDVFLAVGVYAFTSYLVLFRPPMPKRLRFLGPRISPGQATLLGAVLVGLTGLVSLEDLFQVIRIVALPMAVLIGLATIAQCAGQAGLFGWASLQVARRSRGNAAVLFGSIFWLSTLFTVLFPNDANILLFTPVILLMLKNIASEDWREDNSLPFLFAVIFGSNAGGITLITSNPINLIAASYFGISVLEYARWMVVPGLVSALTCYLMLRRAVREQLPRSYRADSLEDPESAIVDRRLFKFSIVVIVAVFVAYFTLPVLGIPFQYAIFTGAAVLLLAVSLHQRTSTREVIKNNPWDEMLFAVCLFLVVFGLRNIGLTEALGNLMAAVSGSSILQAILANLVLLFVGTSLTNDWPMVMISSLSIDGIQSLPPVLDKVLPFIVVMGSNLGAMVIPSASLATLIWMGVIRKLSGREILWRQFIRVGLMVTPLTLLAAGLTLYLEVLLFL